ncbi:Uma2 family endonuclease [Agriterribacter sp.]|uniref:Uma2 family endonuclease n=1 Tax=Agriterribacter sp. TaxID=2821509 RepID=UPI002D08BD78|nr:Uma2 family endonuclease [Agriterribacter sp.]HTN08470.1 Uma2 family endonuclease [Agriterribacter sp.]
MSSSVKILPHYTYADYVQWEGQWELIDGIPYAMSPSPVPKHQRIAGNLLSEFRMQLKNCKKCAVYQPVDYHVADDTILQPDMLIICGAVTKKYLDFPPALVAEILSPATALKDRHTKYGIYESQGIPYFMIIAPDTEEVEIYTLQNGAYTLSAKGRDIKHSFDFEDCKTEIDCKEIW